MNDLLPPPGSIWDNAITGLPMRVVISDETGIVAHDCELRMQPKTQGYGTMVSWAGTTDEFYRIFTPSTRPQEYPPTAGA